MQQKLNAYHAVSFVYNAFRKWKLIIADFLLFAFKWIRNPFSGGTGTCSLRPV